MKDVTEQAGFDLWLDTDARTVTSGAGFAFQRVTRMQGDMRPVLRAPDAAKPDAPYYDIFYMNQAPEAGRADLDRLHLTYGPVLLPPGGVDGEFVKTSGHYHPDMPGSALSYPEIYTGLSGRLLLFLQRRDRQATDTPLDCAIIELTPGVTVAVPPDYAHVLINPGREPALMAGLYGTDFKPDYREVVAHQGLAYYIVEGEDDYRVEANLRYVNAPPLQPLTDVTGTIFEPPDDPTVPVWEAFRRNPDRYAFLSQSRAAADYFARWIP